MDELLEILNEVKPGVDFENDTDLIGHGVLDSITMVTLVMELNDAYRDHTCRYRSRELQNSSDDL